MSKINEIPGPLRRLLEMPNLTDLLLIGAEHSYLDVGKGLEKCANPFDTNQELNQLVLELALAAGGRIDLSSPIGDFVIENFRIHAVLESAISAKPMLSIRKHPKARVLLSHLLEVGMFSETELKFLEGVIAHRENFLIFGSTGSGKTTLLSAMLRHTSDRSIVIEQLPELNPQAPSISLLERKANIEGKGRITTQDLLIEALRMRPDRVIVGEARGSELTLLLQAMNNGHRGSGATIHADRFNQIPQRLIVLGMLAGVSSQLTSQLAVTAIDWVIQLHRSPRKISEIGKLVLRNGTLGVQQVELPGALTQAAA